MIVNVRDALPFVLSTALLGSACASADAPAPHAPTAASVAGSSAATSEQAASAPAAHAPAPVPASATAPPAHAAAPPAGSTAASARSVAPALAASITAAELQARRGTPSAPVVLDVRTRDEFAAGHVPGAVHVPHDQVESRLAELERHRDREIVLYCRSGRRAGVAAEVLRRHGFERLVHLEGDMPGWEAAGLPVAKP